MFCMCSLTVQVITITTHSYVLDKFSYTGSVKEIAYQLHKRTDAVSRPATERYVGVAVSVHGFSC